MTAPEDLPPAPVTANQIYAAVHQLIGQVAALRADVRADDRRLTEHMAEDQRRLTSHDQDIRGLQRRSWALGGGLVVIGLVVAPLLSWLLPQITGG